MPEADPLLSIEAPDEERECSETAGDASNQAGDDTVDNERVPDE